MIGNKRPLSSDTQACVPPEPAVDNAGDSCDNTQEFMEATEGIRLEFMECIGQAPGMANEVLELCRMDYINTGGQASVYSVVGPEALAQATVASTQQQEPEKQQHTLEHPSKTADAIGKYRLYALKVGSLPLNVIGTARHPSTYLETEQQQMKRPRLDNDSSSSNDGSSSKTEEPGSGCSSASAAGTPQVWTLSDLLDYTKGELQNEFDAIRKCSGPNVVKVYGFGYIIMDLDPTKRQAAAAAGLMQKAAFVDEWKQLGCSIQCPNLRFRVPCILMELADCSLSSYVRGVVRQRGDSTAGLGYEQTRSFMYQITTAVAAVHDCQVTHRDLKPGESSTRLCCLQGLLSCSLLTVEWFNIVGA